MVSTMHYWHIVPMKLCLIMVEQQMTLKGKANSFLNHYVKVSNLPMIVEDCNFIREFKKRIDSLSTDNGSCSKLTMVELTSAIQKMKGKGGAGPEDILLTFLKALGPINFQELLKIFNGLFMYADFQRIW